MGLDISYYRVATFVKPEMTDEDWDNDLVHIYVNPDFAERADGMLEGAYKTEGDDGFRAGSYSGYNWWRAKLADMAGTPQSRSGEGKPFHELIWFSDCEGVIGPVTCRKLAEDFAANKKKAQEFSNNMSVDGGYWMQKYEEWERAFRTAAGSGCVRFH